MLHIIEDTISYRIVCFLRGLREKRICFAFGRDGGGGAMAGDYPGFVGENQQARVDGVEDLVVVAAGKISAADAACEEGVASEDHLERSEVEADGALGVAGRVDDVRWETVEADDAAVVQGFIGRGSLRSLYTEPCGLVRHHLEERQVGLMEINGSAGEGFELERATDVVDVSVGNEDLLQG